MTENEQIKELSKILDSICWDVPDEISEHCSIPCSECKAKYLYSKGYRKAYEVAREIFAEIERLLDNHHSACLPVGAIEAYTYYEGGLGDAIAELKKKYTEVEK